MIQSRDDVKQISLLGLIHGVTDATTGYLLFSQLSHPHMWSLFLLYNFGAFMLQPAAGTWIDRWQSPKRGLLLGLLLLVASVLFYHSHIMGGICVAALSSALIHVSGGSLAMGLTPNKTFGAACFTAPGVLGLTCGMWAAFQPLFISVWLVAFLLVLAASAYAVFAPDGAIPITSSNTHMLDAQVPETVLLLLLVAVALRSFLWSSTQQLWVESPPMLFLLAFSAALGKWGGGWLADQWGWGRTANTTAILAIVCLFAGHQVPGLFILGVGLLQMSTPIALTALLKISPQTPATTAGMGLGFAIALGGVPALMSWQPTEINWVWVVLGAGGLWLATMGWSLRQLETSH